MPRPTEPVRRICYADAITVWASGVKIPELEQKVNITEMSRFLWENSLLISAPESSLTLFMPDQAQANTRPKIKIADSEFSLVRSPNILGVYWSVQQKKRLECIGMHQLGTSKGDSTDDI